jgi:rRNA processing protein Krr1/Pno1
MPEIETNQPRMCQKTVDAIKLVAMGLQPQEALQITNHKSKITSEAVRKFNRKFDKYSLVKPDLVKLARNAVKDVLDNKPINGDIYPTHSNKLAAASMVYDRFEPVKSQQAEAGTVITHIDFSVINNSLGVDLGVRKEKEVVDVK